MMDEGKTAASALGTEYDPAADPRSYEQIRAQVMETLEIANELALKFQSVREWRQKLMAREQSGGS